MGAGPALTAPAPQVGGSHSEDSLTGSGSLLHGHVALPGQPSVLPDLARPPDSYSGKSQRRTWAGWQHLGRCHLRPGFSCGVQTPRAVLL